MWVSPFSLKIRAMVKVMNGLRYEKEFHLRIGLCMTALSIFWIGNMDKKCVEWAKPRSMSIYRHWRVSNYRQKQLSRIGAFWGWVNHEFMHIRHVAEHKLKLYNVLALRLAICTWGIRGAYPRTWLMLSCIRTCFLNKMVLTGLLSFVSNFIRKIVQSHPYKLVQPNF